MYWYNYKISIYWSCLFLKFRETFGFFPNEKIVRIHVFTSCRYLVFIVSILNNIFFTKWWSQYFQCCVAPTKFISCYIECEQKNYAIAEFSSTQAATLQSALYCARTPHKYITVHPIDCNTIDKDRLCRCI